MKIESKVHRLQRGSEPERHLVVEAVRRDDDVPRVAQKW